MIANRQAITVHDGKMVAEASDLFHGAGFPDTFEVPARNGGTVTFIAAMDIRDPRENEIVKVLYIAPAIHADLVVFND